ncbi:MAG: Sensor protein ZraS [Verrucomicrobiota bacterium]
MHNPQMTNLPNPPTPNGELPYKSLVNQLPQCILRKDIQGRFTFANQRFCSLINRPLKDIIGKTDFDLFPAAQIPKPQ